MWCDHPFSQRNRTTERRVEVGVGGDREVGGEGGQNLGDIHILGVLASLFQLCKETSKIFHPPL